MYFLGSSLTYIKPWNFVIPKKGNESSNQAMMFQGLWLLNFGGVVPLRPAICWVPDDRFKPTLQPPRWMSTSSPITVPAATPRNGVGGPTRPAKCGVLNWGVPRCQLREKVWWGKSRATHKADFEKLHFAHVIWNIWVSFIDGWGNGEHRRKHDKW